jgi:hypothetical protein
MGLAAYGIPFLRIETLTRAMANPQPMSRWQMIRLIVQKKSCELALS